MSKTSISWDAAKLATKWLAIIAVILLGIRYFGSWFFSTYPYRASNAQALIAEFAASRALAVFPVELPGGSFGLVVLDRETGKSRLVAQYRTRLSRPRLSKDRERLLIVREQADKDTRELLTCQVSGWKCRVLWQTENNIQSPIELEKGVVLLAASPKIVRSDGSIRYSDYDFYLVREGAEPEKLSDFGFSAVYSLDLMGERLLFSASAGKASFLRKFQPTARAGSEIFALNFDRSRPRLNKPTEVLEPQFLLDAGWSYSPSASEDAQLVAFRNRGAPSRFDLVIADPDGTVRKRVVASGFGFSRPAFVGRTVVANELTPDAYVIRAFDVDAGTEQMIAKFDLSTDFSKLDPIPIQILP